MQLSGRFPPLTSGQQVQRVLGFSLLTLVVLPWLLMGLGCVAVGILAISRGERALLICLPAGLALLIAGPLMVYLNRRWYPPVCRFDLDGETLRYAFREDRPEEVCTLADVRQAVPRYAGKRRHRLIGYVITFAPGDRIFIPRGLTHADELFETLQARATVSS